MPFAPVVGVFSCVGEGADGVCGVFGGVALGFVPADGVFSCVGEGADGVCGVFGGVALGFVPTDGVDVDEIGVFGALGAVFGLVCRCAGCV